MRLAKQSKSDVYGQLNLIHHRSRLLVVRERISSVETSTP